MMPLQKSSIEPQHQLPCRFFAKQLTACKRFMVHHGIDGPTSHCSALAGRFCYRAPYQAALTLRARTANKKTRCNVGFVPDPTLHGRSVFSGPDYQLLVADAVAEVAKGFRGALAMLLESNKQGNQCRHDIFQ